MPKLPSVAPEFLKALRGLEEAVQHQRQGLIAQADHLYRRVLKKNPVYLDALHLYGLFKYQQGKFDDAEKLIAKATKVHPQSVNAFNSLGIVLQARKRHMNALAAFDHALALDPNFVIALNNRGNTLITLDRPQEAISSFDRALAIDPQYADALINRGNALSKLRAYKEALASCDRAIAVAPLHSQAHTNRGAVLFKLKQYEEALVSSDRALALDPSRAEAHHNRSNILERLGRYPEAFESCERALALDPTFTKAYHSRGILLQNLRRNDEALACFDKALALDPNFAEAHNSAGHLLLLNGNFDRGLREYEWRWKVEDPTTPARKFSKPMWLGDENIFGKTILLHAEQGYGDTIQFCRYAKILAEQGATVILEIQKLLMPLAASLEGVAQVISSTDNMLPPFDFHCPHASLPYAFKTRLETIPATVPYLSASAAHIEKWKQRLPETSNLKVCVNWAGNPAFENDAQRSILLPGILPLVLERSATFFAIQKDLRTGDRKILRNSSQINYLGEQIESFEDTAAIIMLTDLVISSDTSVVHLAGALGKPVWVLLSFIPDWRWLSDRHDSPWYPTARLFRQTSPGDWKDVVERVSQELQQLVSTR